MSRTLTYSFIALFLGVLLVPAGRAYAQVSSIYDIQPDGTLTVYTSTSMDVQAFSGASLTRGVTSDFVNPTGVSSCFSGANISTCFTDTGWTKNASDEFVSDADTTISSTDGEFWFRVNAPNAAGAPNEYWFPLIRDGGVWSSSTDEPVGNGFVGYIPSTNVSEPLGSLVLGAEFQMQDTGALDSVSYSLFDLNSNLLFFSTTTPGVGFTQVSTTTNLATGSYIGMAAYRTSSTTDYIIVPFNQTVLINQSSYSVDPSTGQFLITPSGTTTPADLKAWAYESCPVLDLFGFETNTHCDVIIWLLVPDVGAVTSLQAAWNRFLSNGPLILYQQAKSVLVALSPSSNNASQGLTLTFFGEEAPVITASTSDAIGFNSTYRNFIGNLIAGGLYMFLLWYLFWRGASYLERIRRNFL